MQASTIKYRYYKHAHFACGKVAKTLNESDIFRRRRACLEFDRLDVSFLLFYFLFIYLLMWLS